MNFFSNIINKIKSVTVKDVFVGRKLTSYLNLGAAAMCLITMITFCVYGAVNRYYDSIVCLNIILAMLCFTGYFLFNAYKGGRVLNIIGVILLSFALTFFFINSYPVWADELNGITMYGSRGGLAPVIAIIVMMVLSVVAGIVSCFLQPEERRGA